MVKKASTHRSEPARPRAGQRGSCDAAASYAADDPGRGRRGSQRGLGFTLTELMIAVAILIVVIVATAKLFGTVSKVTGLGQASSDILQEAAAIERQIRNDFARLAPEGFFAIRSVAVVNNLHVLSGGPLLNPGLPDDAMIRADQLVFFANGVQSIQTFRQGAGSNRKGQGTAARIYYGHAFQLPQGEAMITSSFGPAGSSYVRAHDPVVDLTNPLVPWYRGDYDMVRTVFQPTTGGTPADYSTTDVGPIDATQPPARQWLLARQAVVLADDGGDEVVFLGNVFGEGGNRSTFTIWEDVIRNGRVDAAAEQLNGIRTAVVGDGTVPWIPVQRDTIASAVFYPRAERVAPGMHRVDQALTNNALAGACSSFIIDWTYADGVGDAVNDAGTFFPGAQIIPSVEQPWFGLDLDGSRGVDTFGNWPSPPNRTVFADNIDGAPLTFTGQVLQSAGADVYEAIFGYNQDQPLDPATGLPDVDLAYTPWPSAIRITMTLHDTATRLEAGREIQFVINLPRRIE
ncbi:MAG: type II secretion system protein [Planctomycetes bacterium]|nr:type II secretion system protein [Planctomycetota bacterium]